MDWAEEEAQELMGALRGGFVGLDDCYFRTAMIFFEFAYAYLNLFSSSPFWINTMTLPTPARPVRPNRCTIRIGEARQS